MVLPRAVWPIEVAPAAVAAETMIVLPLIPIEAPPAPEIKSEPGATPEVVLTVVLPMA